MKAHQDVLRELTKQGALRDKLVSAHQSMQQIFPFIARIAITIYDPQSHYIKSYLHSKDDDDNAEHYEELLDNMPSLKNIIKKGLPRVIPNHLTYENTGQENIMRIGRHDYGASYTLPMFNNGVFFGFIFFNSQDKSAFTDYALQQIDMYGHILSLMIINELSSIKTLIAAVKTTGHITHTRDPETGSHLDRMSRFSRLIANALADKYQLDENYVEHIFMFSSLHDIGKIAIPDYILLKEDQLDADEWVIMKTHPYKGLEIIDELLANFGLENIEYIEVFRNIVEYHHEAIDGSGYPHGLKDLDIPLEARIVAVADIFDALTSKRPYKQAWRNEAAIKILKEYAGTKLDTDCVNALIDNLDQVKEIQSLFKETIFG